MFTHLGQFVARHWLAVVVGWVAMVALLRWAAPAWEDVTCDGDLAFLPNEMPSVVGEQLLAEAFPQDRAKSELAVFVAHADKQPKNDDFSVATDLARQFKNLFGAAALSQAQRLSAEAERLRAAGQVPEASAAAQRAEKWLQKADDALEEALRLDELLADSWDKKIAAANDGARSSLVARRPEPLAAAHFNRSLLHRLRGDTAAADGDLALAIEWDASFRNRSQPFPDEAARLPLLDVWTWQDDVFGKKLKTSRVRVIVLKLSNEFMAVGNIWVLDYLETVLDSVRDTVPTEQRGKLQIGYSGSAAVGGDLLRAARDSIRNTELFTVLLVVLILSVVYRSPLLVIMPLVTIGTSVVAATSLVALLTQLHQVPGFDWWTFKTFTTTKVFIVVILYGAGTDFFLFLAARYREELEQGHDHTDAVARSLGAVGHALAASALTTILGLATMFFADFGKFSNSGPAIALCLAVTLAASLTLAPALLQAFGRLVFWPFGGPRVQPALSRLQTEGSRIRQNSGGRGHDATFADAPNSGEFGYGVESAPFHGLWERIARGITAQPQWILLVSVLVLLGPAVYGLLRGEHITYDFLRQLPPERPSRQGAELMREHFPVGEAGPLTVVAYQPDGGFHTKEGREKIDGLTKKLYVPGVAAVRSLADPLGDFAPTEKQPAEKTRGESRSLFHRKTWRNWVAKPHPRTQEIFVATEGRVAGAVTRLDLVLEYDPFSVEAEETLTRVEQRLRAIREDSQLPWHGATFAFSGITAGLRDLKLVTQSDNRRIQILVVLAVLAVLLLLLRRPLICLYMIATVLFSYYVTLGITEWFFAATDPDFLGLDWKVPVFLFVILVAVGQDYNIYLATRVFEEQARRGPIAGLQFAVVRTGGIITSCGVIMAGTFVSMTCGTWAPALSAWFPLAGRWLGAEAGALPAIVQLGFALSLGILLDTFIVRPVLVPAFLALLGRGPDPVAHAARVR